MNSLKEVYQSLDQTEKVAEEQQVEVAEQTKLAYQQAMEYDEVGRALARQVYGDMVKSAAAHLPEGHGEGFRHSDGWPCADDCGGYTQQAEGNDKVASVKEAILERMAQDPDYVAALIAKH